MRIELHLPTGRDEPVKSPERGFFPIRHRQALGNEERRRTGDLWLLTLQQPHQGTSRISVADAMNASKA